MYSFRMGLCRVCRAGRQRKNPTRPYASPKEWGLGALRGAAHAGVYAVLWPALSQWRLPTEREKERKKRKKTLPRIATENPTLIIRKPYRGRVTTGTP